MAATATTTDEEWPRVLSHFEHRSEYVVDLLKQSEHPLKDKLFAFAEQPAPSVSVIDISEMDEEAINALMVFSTYMHPFKRVLIVTNSKDAASDVIPEYAGRFSEKREQLIRRVFPDVPPRFGNPNVLIPNTQTIFCNSTFDLHVLYPTHLTRFFEQYNDEPIDMVVVRDTKEPRRWTTIAPRVIEKYGKQAKILLLTARPEAYNEFTQL